MIIAYLVFGILVLITRKMGKSLALLGRLPDQLNVLSTVFCDKLVVQGVSLGAIKFKQPKPSPDTSIERASP